MGGYYNPIRPQIACRTTCASAAMPLAGARRLRAHLAETGAQLPPDLARLWAQADFLVFKGDANYRRLAEDRHWPTTTRLADITRYLPAPAAVLRTLKSELVLDLAPGQAQDLADQDRLWMINGERGVIQLLPHHRHGPGTT